MGFWSTIGGALGSLIPGVGPVVGPLIGGLGQAAGSAASSMAGNRGQQLAASQLADQIATARAAEDRTQRESAWKQLLQADYARGSGGYKPPTFTYGSELGIAPHTLPMFGSARTSPYSATVQRGAAGLENEVMARLMGGSQLPPLTDVSKAAKPSIWERLLGIGSAVAPIYGAAVGSQSRGLPGTSIGLPAPPSFGG